MQEVPEHRVFVSMIMRGWCAGSSPLGHWHAGVVTDQTEARQMHLAQTLDCGTETAQFQSCARGDCVVNTYRSFHEEVLSVRRLPDTPPSPSTIRGAVSHGACKQDMLTPHTIAVHRTRTKFPCSQETTAQLVAWHWTSICCVNKTFLPAKEVKTCIL